MRRWWQMPLHSSPTAIGEEMMLKVMLPAYIPISAVKD
jgi:hypothetical protein